VTTAFEGKMNAQNTSALGSGAILAAGLVAGWLASKGIITTPDIPAWTAFIGAVFAALVGGVVAYIKIRSQTADAIINAATHQPGVISVVTTTAVASSEAHADNNRVVDKMTFASAPTPAPVPTPPKG
jgi:hypothetical protein